MEPVLLPHDEFLRYLQEQGERADPVHGFFGPRSVSWRINRSIALHLGGPRALLLQLAHPKVAQGISDHSRVNDDLVGRFVRTFVPVYQVIFGTRDQALEAAAIMHKVHGRVHGVLTENTGRHRKGDAYDALDPILVRWVWATLVDSATRMYELFVGELSDDAKARYYRESLRFTRLMGLYDESVPPDWRAFEFWMSRTLHSDEIGVSLTARKFTRRLLGAPGSLRPVGFGSRLIAAGTLPPHLRDGFHLPWGRRTRATYAAGRMAALLATRAMPTRMQTIPQAWAADRRCAA